MNPNDLLDTFKGKGCFPHQAKFAAAFFAPGSARKHLLIGGIGTGKGFTVGAIIGHAISSGQASRILVLAPLALLAQWRAIIKQGAPDISLLTVDRRRFREIEDSHGVGEGFWPAHSIVLMSIDFAKQMDVLDSLTCTSWDVLVVDEVQLATPQTQRGKVLLHLLSRLPSTRSLLLQVNGPWDSSETETSTGSLHDVATTLWTRESIRDNEGNPLLPDVHIEWIIHQRQADEAAVLARLQDSLRSLLDGSPQSRLIARTLLQTASSSLFALEQRLRQMRQWRSEGIHGIGGGMENELDTEEEGLQEPLVGDWAGQVDSRSELTEVTEPILQLLDEVRTDSKFNGLLSTSSRICYSMAV